MGLGNGVRADGLVLSVLKEGATPTFVKDVSFEANKKPVAGLTDIDSTLGLDPIENESIKSADLGAQPNTPSPQFKASPITNTQYMKGLTVPAGDTILADVADPMVVQLAACLGGTPLASTGSTVSISDTASSFTEDVEDAHVKGDFLIWLDADGCAEVRRIETYLTGVIEVNAPFSAIPQVGDVLYGTVRIPIIDKHSYFMQGDAISPEVTSPRNKEFYGAVGTFTRPASAVDEAPAISFTYNVGAYLRGGNGSAADKSQIDPPSQRMNVAAGGTYILQQTSDLTDALVLDFLQDDFDLARTYQAFPGAGTKRGINNWVHVGSNPVSNLLIHETETLPVGFTVADFYDSWQQGKAENSFRVLMGYGIEPGAVMGYHYPDAMQQQEPRESAPNNIAALSLRFEPRTNGGDATQPLVEWFVG
jgi:hypothetical protein